MKSGVHSRSKKCQVDEPRGGRVVSARKLEKMKREAQARDRALVGKGGAIDEMFLIRPHLVRSAKVVWPDDD